MQELLVEAQGLLARLEAGLAGQPPLLQRKHASLAEYVGAMMAAPQP